MIMVIIAKTTTLTIAKIIRLAPCSHSFLHRPYESVVTTEQGSLWHTAIEGGTPFPIIWRFPEMGLPQNGWFIVYNGKASTPNFRKPPSAKDLLCTCIGSTQRKDDESTVQQKLATFHHFLSTMTRTGQKGCGFAGRCKQTGQSVCCLACKARPHIPPASRCHLARQNHWPCWPQGYEGLEAPRHGTLRHKEPYRALPPRAPHIFY